MNYTVSCSGDVTCPSNFSTIGIQYTITNLTPMTNYIFSVVATNSIGSGEAGVVMIITPGTYVFYIDKTYMIKFSVIRKIFHKRKKLPIGKNYSNR